MAGEGVENQTHAWPLGPKYNHQDKIQPTTIHMVHTLFLVVLTPVNRSKLLRCLPGLNHDSKAR